MKRPNIIIINPDEMRADAMRHLGNAAAYTPNLDRMADEGVSFSNAFCQNPVCVPSRCSFMTGLYPHVNGHRTMEHLLRPGEGNLFKDMKQAGYYTVSSTRGDLMAGQYPKYHKDCIDQYLMVGRMEKKPPFKPNRGNSDSDTFYSFLDGIIPTRHPDERADNMDDLITDEAVSFIHNSTGEKPFFMFVGLMYPHPPYQIEKKYYDMIDKDLLPKRIPTIQPDDKKPAMEVGLCETLRVANWNEERLDEIRTIYLAMCAKVDEQVGRIVTALKEKNIYDNTILLFFSDHGDYATDFGLVEKSQNCFPDCLTRVPFIVKPAQSFRIDAGINENLIELTDVCATVAAMADIPITRPMFSKSLVPTMQDKNVAHREFVTCEGGRLPSEPHCAEYHEENFDPADHYAPKLLLQSKNDGTHTKAVMIRNKKYKYVFRLQESDEFYDLQLGEQKNRIDDGKYAEEIRRMKDFALAWYVQTCDIVPRELDDRFPAEFLLNNLRAAGVPGIIAKLFLFSLKLRRKTPSQFIDEMRKRI